MRWQQLSRIVKRSHDSNFEIVAVPLGIMTCHTAETTSGAPAAADDGRISRNSREWAEKVPVSPEDQYRVYFRVTQVNPGLLDIFVRQTREVLEKRPREQQPER